MKKKRLSREGDSALARFLRLKDTYFEDPVLKKSIDVWLKSARRFGDDDERRLYIEHYAGKVTIDEVMNKGRGPMKHYIVLKLVIDSLKKNESDEKAYELGARTLEKLKQSFAD